MGELKPRSLERIKRLNERVLRRGKILTGRNCPKELRGVAFDKAAAYLTEIGKKITSYRFAVVTDDSTGNKSAVLYTEPPSVPHDVI